MPDDPLSASSFGRRLALLTAAGLAVRIGFLLLEPRARLAGDESTWTALALRGVLLPRHAFSPLKSPILFYPPAYPYFIAAIHALLGGLTAVKWVQALAGALLVPAVGRAVSLASSARAGLFAAGAAAFYPELVWFSVHFWSETLFLVLLWWGFERVLAAQSSGRTGAGRRWAPAAGFVAAAVLTVAPWTYRNWVVFHAFVPVSTFGAHSLWQGNTRLPLDEFYRQTDSVPGPIAQYRLARERALSDIRERQPLWLFEKIRVELPELWAPATHVSVLLDRNAYGPVGVTARALIEGVMLAPYLAIVALAVPGLAALRLTAGRLLLLLFFVYYNALHVVTYGQDRFRLPVMPVLFLAAGEAWTAWRAGTFPSLTPARRALLLGLALLTAAVVLPGLL